VLEAIQREHHKCIVIVISGDIQPDARQRVLRLGALEFIRKPINQSMLAEVLQRFGLL
jgi:response regulator of citrate/malate metabolism